MPYIPLPANENALLDILDTDITFMAPVREPTGVVGNGTVRVLATRIWVLWRLVPSGSVDFAGFSRIFGDADPEQVHRVFCNIAPYKKKKLRLGDLESYLCVLTDYDLHRLAELGPLSQQETDYVEVPASPPITEAMQHSAKVGSCTVF